MFYVFNPTLNPTLMPVRFYVLVENDANNKYSGNDVIHISYYN